MNEGVKLAKQARVKALGYKAKMNLDNLVMDLEMARQAARKLRRPMTKAEFDEIVTTLIEYLGEAEIQALLIPTSAQEDLATACTTNNGG